MAEIIRRKNRALLHGTEANYAKGCRCADCTLHHSNLISGRIEPIREELVPAEPWRTIIRAVALQMDTDPARLVTACGLNGRTAEGILSGRYRTLSPYTDQRLRKLLELLPSEAGG
jgi:hypothetical protein